MKKISFRSVFALVALIGLLMPAEARQRSERPRARNHPLIGGVFKPKDKSFKGGVYSIPTDGTTDMSLLLANLKPNGGGVLVGGKYYSVSYSESFWGIVNVTYSIYDATTWEREKVNSFSDDWSVVALDMAYDAVDDKVFGCFYNKAGNGYVFGTLDLSDGRTRTQIAVLDKDNPWYGVAAAPDGTLYAIDKGGKLYTVDKTTGATAFVGDTGIAAVDLASAAIDQKDGRMYYSRYSPSESAIYEIDTQTAQATLVAQYTDYQFVGLCVPDVEAEGDAPAAVTDLQAIFTGNSLAGTLRFDAPTTNFAGEPASGILDYGVRINGTECASGTTEYGAVDVTVPVTVSEAGSYEISVVVGRNGNNSPETMVTCWVGDDVPSAPANVRMVLAGNNFDVTWDAVTTGIHGGYIDAAGVTYDVTRYPGAINVGRDVIGTSFSEPFVEPAEGFADYYYSVVSRYAGASSEAGVSNRQTLGAVINPPYLNDFASQDMMNGYTCLNLKDKTGEINWEYDTYRECVSIKWTPYKAMDAWLITPRIWFEAGKVYKFSFDACGSDDDYTERVEAFLGTQPMGEYMTVRLVERTELKNSFSSKVTLEGEITVSSTGVYYVGIHGCSQEDQYKLNIDNIQMGAGVLISAPDAVTALKVVPDPDGLPRATVSFNAPLADIDGNAVTGLAKIEISRDNECIKIFDAPAVGESMSYVDNDVMEGMHVYSVVAFNEGGAGKKAEASVYVGIDLPVAPVSAMAVETDTPGEVTVSWVAPPTDIHGNPLNPENVTYAIRDYENNVVAEGVEGLYYTYMAVPQGQTFKRYKVYASTVKGMCKEYALTDMIPVGTPYALPVAESFVGAKILNESIIKDNCIWTWEKPLDSRAVWQTYSDGGGIAAQDGDNAFIGSYSERQGDETMLYSGKINLAGATNPTLVFHYYGFKDCGNTIQVKVDSGNGFETVESFVAGAPYAEWVKEVVSLEAYKDKTVKIGFNTRTVDYSYVVIDNIEVVDMKCCNLTAARIEIPRKMHSGQESKIMVRVENSGVQEASGYTVELYRNNEPVQSVEGPAIGVGEDANIWFVETPSVASERSLRYYAVVDYAEDEDGSDNTTSVVISQLVLPPYPAVKDLKAVENSGNVDLTWSSPDMSEAPFLTVTDDFEDYSQFAIDSAGKWSFVDGDGSFTHGFGDALVFPGMESPMAYIVFDNTGITTTNMFVAHSGCRYMASFAAINGQNDDWMISPELNGSAQMVSFWAKTYAGNYGREEFEFLYSTTGKNVGDFVKIGEDHNVPVEWTEYEYSLPEGARYFAIRCVSRDCFIFFVDDVTYIPSGAKRAELEILGYNIYRDGLKINDGIVADPAYMDRYVETKEHVYGVSTVYDLGESCLSNLVSASSYLDGIGSDGSVDIASENGCIVVSGIEGLPVSIYDVAGVMLFAEVASCEEIRIPVVAGVYVVKAGSLVVKIMVK